MLAHEAFELPFRAGSERPLVPKFPFWDATPRPQPVARWPASPPSSARALRVHDCAGTPRLAVAKNVRYVQNDCPQPHKHCPRSILDPINKLSRADHLPTLGERDSPQISHGPVLSLLPFGFIIIYNVGARPEAKVTQSRRSGVIFCRSS
jgi:hypothetical protein